MALPNSTDLQTMDYSYAGLPFVDVPAKGDILTGTMDWSYAGLPFVTNPGLQGPTNVGGFDGVASTNLQTIAGVAYTNLETIMGVT